MDPLDDPAQYLKIDEAARILGVSRRWVYRRIWENVLPASKVGGIYFIQRADLLELLDKHRAAPLPQTSPLSKIEKCGYCFRLLNSDGQIGEICQAQGCEKLICNQCLAEGIHYCSQHVPARAQLLDEAQKRYEQGEIPILVKSSTARLLEVNFINRIQARISRISNLIHPLTNELLTINGWEEQIEQGDERGEVMRLLNKVVLDSETLAQTPLNAHLTFTFPQQRRQKSPSLEFWVQVISRLTVMLRDGFDTQPLDIEEVQPWLLRFITEAGDKKVFRLIVLASPTGFDHSVRQVVQGEASGSAFMHQMLLVYLYDMPKGELIYNLQDERARPYAELITPLLPGEQLKELAQAIEKELLLHQSLALEYATQIFPYAPELVQQAFENLAAGGRYSLIQMPEYGLVIVRK